MSMRNAVAVALLGASAFAVSAEPKPLAPALGAPMTAEEAAKWDLSVFPNGEGLPPGKGTAAEGKQLFADKCEHCHGRAGRGATAEELVGDPATPPSVDNPNKTIGPYWPHATTAFDFIRRSKPPENPGSFTADQVYALVAYLLAANKVIAETDMMTAATLPKVKMPNRNGFLRIDAP
ncbi:MAG: c-type cytochrome [Hyphomicrobium sp.]